jgi:phosphatidylserine/phosphatidylglycerophosphate/cardiolipin synthase-like enzyme
LEVSNNGVERMNLLQKIFNQLAKNNGQIPLHKLLSEFETETQPMAELKLMTLVRSGHIEFKKEAADYMVILKKPFEKQALPKDQPMKQFSSQKRISVQMNPVVTLPASLQVGFSPSERVLMTDEAFELLLNSASKYVKISLPFPEEAIIAHFSNKLKRLSREGINVSVLTREIVNPLRKDYGYLSIVKAVLRMWDVYISGGNRGVFSVRDFHENLTLGTSQPRHYESTHAKMLLVDGVECYVGSAEFRINSLYNNFELGFLVKGGPVQAIESLFNIVWQHGTPVTYDFLRGIAKGL